MEGLVREALKHTGDEAPKNADLLDVEIIAQYQRMSHYGIAGFGTATAYAEALGMQEHVARLKSIVSEIDEATSMPARWARRRPRRHRRGSPARPRRQPVRLGGAALGLVPQASVTGAEHRVPLLAPEPGWRPRVQPLAGPRLAASRRLVETGFTTGMAFALAGCAWASLVGSGRASCAARRRDAGPLRCGRQHRPPGPHAGGKGGGRGRWARGRDPGTVAVRHRCPTAKAAGAPAATAAGASAATAAGGIAAAPRLADAASGAGASPGWESSSDSTMATAEARAQSAQGQRRGSMDCGSGSGSICPGAAAAGCGAARRRSGDHRRRAAMPCGARQPRPA